MQKQKTFLVPAGVMTGLYALWLTPGWWNLGFGVINTIYLMVVGFSFKKKILKNNYVKFLWGASLALGWFQAIRSFEFVQFLTISTVIILNVLISALARASKARLGAERLVRTMIGLAGGVLGTGREVLVMVSKKKGGDISKMVVGVIISIPLLVIFGRLFYAADPIFAKLVDQIRWPKINLNEKLIWDVMTSGVFFGWVLSSLKARLAKRLKTHNVLKQITEVNVAVTMVEGLFLLFTMVEIRYFLATAAELREMGIVFSTYTRQGYGEMIMASLMAYGIVMLLEYSIRSQKKMGMVTSSYTKWLSVTIIGEIFVFVLAATKRNYIYQAAYGFTEIRLLGFALSIWLVAMLGLILLKVLKSKTEDSFVRGVIMVTTMAVLGLNIFDIDGTIVRAKPASLDNGVDYRYLTTLSDDVYGGLEMIMAGVEGRIEKAKYSLERSDYIEVHLAATNLETKYKRLKDQAANNWRWGGSWNYGAMKTYQFLENNKNRLERMSQDINYVNEEIDEKIRTQKNIRVHPINSDENNVFVPEYEVR